MKTREQVVQAAKTIDNLRDATRRAFLDAAPHSAEENSLEDILLSLESLQTEMAVLIALKE